MVFLRKKAKLINRDNLSLSEDHIQVRLVAFPPHKHVSSPISFICTAFLPFFHPLTHSVFIRSFTLSILPFNSPPRNAPPYPKFHELYIVDKHISGQI